MIWASDARDFTVTGASLEDENVSNGSDGRAVHGRHRVLPAFPGCTIPGAQAAADWRSGAPPIWFWGKPECRAAAAHESCRLKTHCTLVFLLRHAEFKCCLTGRGQNSMSIQEVSAEQLAELLHHYHQALGPDFSGESKPDAEAWEQVPQPEKKRLVAAARLALLELSVNGKRGRLKALFCKAGPGRMGLLTWGRPGCREFDIL